MAPTADYRLRDLDLADPGEVNTAAAFSMATILETLPEARRDPEIVPGFSIEAMAAMYARGHDNPDHRYRVAVDHAGLIVGHAIALMRADDHGVAHGYSYTRYVLPAHRRRGLARRLLVDALGWWTGRGARYVLAHTHADNTALQRLFATAGFTVVERTHTRWAGLTLRLDAPATSPLLSEARSR